MGAADKLDDTSSAVEDSIYRVETDPSPAGEGVCQAETKVGVFEDATIAEMLAEAERREAESTIPPASEVRPSRSGPKPAIRKRRTNSMPIPKAPLVPNVVEPVVDEALPVIESDDEEGVEPTFLNETLMRPKARAPEPPVAPPPIMSPSPVVREMMPASPSIAVIPPVHEIVIVDPNGTVGIPGDVARAVVASVEARELERELRRSALKREILIGMLAGLVAAALLLYALFP
jgi:hypothetical protein